MPRYILFGAFFIGLLAIGHAEPSILNRRLLAKSATANASSTAVSTGEEGEASASSTATSTGGTTIAKAFANSTIIEEVAFEVREMWREFQKTVSDESTCDEIIAAADTTVDERLEALAAVYATAFGSVSVDGTGSGCVGAESSGNATASAYLQVIIDLLVEVKFEGEDAKNGAFATAYGNLVGAATAKAWANALIDGCAAADQGEAFLFAKQETFATATATPAIIAFAWAQASAECGEKAFSESGIEGLVSNDGNSKVTSDSETETKGPATASAEGAGGATTEEDPKLIVDVKIAEAERCRSSYIFCCTTSPNEICRCTSSQNERLYRCKAEASEGTDKILWVDSEKNKECYCDKN